MLRPLSFLIMIVFTTQSIFLALKPKTPRCMVEYIAGSSVSTSMKIKILFPKIKDHISHEHFYVTLRNTQNDEIQSQVVSSGGKYIKEAQFVSNVIYEVCILFRTDRKLDQVVEYEAEGRYQNTGSFSQVSIPENLLQKKDFEKAYIAAAHLIQTIKGYTQDHTAKQKETYKSFAIIEGINNTLTWITSIELVVLLAAGAYQFFSLRNYLFNKQYI